MKFLLALVLLLGSLSAQVADSDKLTLPDASSILLSSQEGEKEITYELAHQRPGAPLNRIWKHVVPKREGSIRSWFKLLSCDEKDGGISVLMEMDEFTLMLVQHSKAETRETVIPAGEVLSRQRATLAKLRVQAPNQVILSQDSGEEEILTVDAHGKLLQKDGKPASENLSIEIVPQSEKSISPSPTKEEDTPASAPEGTQVPPSKEAPARDSGPLVSMPVAGAVATVMALLGALWVFLKRKSVS